MRRFAWFFLVCSYCAHAQTASSLSFSLDRTGPPAQRYEIHLDEATGRGVYRSELPAVGAGATTAAPPERPIAVDPALVKKLFAAVPIVKANRCNSHMKNIAQTGTKTLRYLAEGAAAECTYNYSNEDRVNTATSLFEAVAETLQIGERLTAKLRFDRLGLDAEMDDLQSALQDGRAIEVGNIAPVLASIAGDDRVMERVQRKAARLLQGVAAPEAQVSGSAIPSSDR